MTARQPLVLALTAGLVGLLVGFLAAQAFAPDDADRASGPVRLDGGGAERADAQGPAPATSLVLDEAGARRTNTGSTREAAFAPSAAAVDRAVAAIETPVVADLEFEGSITGKVIDRAGRPVAGAVLKASRAYSRVNFQDPSAIGRASVEPPDLETYLRDRADDWARTRSASARVRSLASGQFTIEGLDPDAEYTVTASADGHTVVGLGDTYNVTCGDELTFVAEPVCAITVELRDANGVLLEEGAVQVTRGNSTTNYEWSPEQMVLKLSAGPCQLRGYSEIFEDAAYSRTSIDAGAASEEVSIRAMPESGDGPPTVLTVVPRIGIRGRVVNGARRGGANVIRLLPMAPGEELDLEALGQVETDGWQQNARFAFHDLTPGRYAVGATTWQGQVLAHEVVDVADATVEVELRLDDIAPESMLAVRAIDPDGLPLFLETCSLATRYVNGGSSSNGLSLVRRELDVSYYSDPNGRDPFGDGVQREIESRTLTVTDQVFGSMTMELAPDEMDVTVQFQVPATLVVQVARVEQSGTSGRLRVSVAPVSESSSGSNSGYISMGYSYGGQGSNRTVPLDGTVRFDSLAPGRYKVVLAIGQRWDAREVESREIDVLEGEALVEMVAPDLYELRVVAPQLSENTRVTLRERKEGEDASSMRRFRGNNLTARVDDQGIATFEDLMAGDYVLSASGVSGQMDVSVPSTDVLFDARSPDALRVTISDVEGRMYLAGLRSGDMIVGVSGVDAGNADAMRNALYRPGDDVAEQILTVVRDGSELTLTLAAPGDGNSRQPGASLRPAYLED